MTATEHDLRQLLERRALEVDEYAITGETVRRRLTRRRRTSLVAPLATAATVLALIAGATAAVVIDTNSKPTPATSNPPTVVTSPSDGLPPQCPAVVRLPDSGNTVCIIGTPPSIPPGSGVILHPETP